MSIRAIAQEVYKCQSRVHDLEERLENAAPAEWEDIREALRQARAELKKVKVMLDNRKESPFNKKKRFPFRF